MISVSWLFAFIAMTDKVTTYQNFARYSHVQNMDVILGMLWTNQISVMKIWMNSTNIVRAAQTHCWALKMTNFENVWILEMLKPHMHFVEHPWSMGFGIRSTEFWIFEFNVTLASWSIVCVVCVCVCVVCLGCGCICVCLCMERAEDNLRCSSRVTACFVEIRFLVNLELTE